MNKKPELVRIKLADSGIFKGGTMKKPLSNRQIMNRIYQDISGFEIPKVDIARIKESKGSPVYGEINTRALEKLHEYLDIRTGDIFYDLGSGVGKVVLQTGLFTKAQKVVGVELSENRHEDAMAALKRASEIAPLAAKKCSFINDDLMNIDLSSASIIYTCSTAFSDLFMRQIAKRLADFSHKYRLVTLQELPNEKHLKRVDTIYLDMSWARKTAVHIYEREQQS